MGRARLEQRRKLEAGLSMLMRDVMAIDIVYVACLCQWAFAPGIVPAPQQRLTLSGLKFKLVQGEELLKSCDE